MASIPPGDIVTQPSHKIVFNAPFDQKHTYYIRVSLPSVAPPSSSFVQPPLTPPSPSLQMYNSSGRQIGWAIKTTNPRRLGVDPPCGVLDPKESVLMAVSCNAIESEEEQQAQTSNDRITVEWTNTPEGATKQFRREWFQGDGMVRRKNLPIEYNH